MGLEEVLESVWKFGSDNWPLLTIGVGLLAYGVGVAIGSRSRREQLGGTVDGYSETGLEEEVNEDYRPTSMINLDREEPETLYRIKGAIQEFHLTGEGYSGRIALNGSNIPFYIDTDITDYYEEEALIPLLLNDSQQMKKSIEFDVEVSESKILNVDALRYTMNGVRYEIPQP